MVSQKFRNWKEPTYNHILDITIFYTNLNSIMAKFSTLKIDVDKLQVVLIIITETCLHSKIPDTLIHVTRYMIYRNDRVRARSEDVIIYVQKQDDILRFWL